MTTDTAKYPWSESQWAEISQIVQEESTKSSVAGGFLPCYGPLSASTEIIRRENVIEDDPYIHVDDIQTLTLWTLSVHVQLKQQQLAEDNLAGAHLAFRRAANLIARAEDAIVFHGLPKGGPTRKELDAIGVPAQCKVTSGEKMEGLVAAGGLPEGHLAEDRNARLPHDIYYGQQLVVAVSEAIADLEGRGHLGPFACVLGNHAFVQAQTPEKNSMVLPSDRMKPILNGPVLRAGTMNRNDGVVVSLAGNPIDLVVASEPKAQFLHLTEDARAVFRVYERFSLRIKEVASACSFFLKPDEEAYVRGSNEGPK